MTLGIVEPSGSTGRIPALTLASIFRAVPSMVPDVLTAAGHVAVRVRPKPVGLGEVRARGCTQSISDDDVLRLRDGRTASTAPTSGRNAFLKEKPPAVSRRGFFVFSS